MEPPPTIELTSNGDLAVIAVNVNVKIAETSILTNMNLTVQKSTIYSLLGPSGSGKTTFLRCTIGFIRPDSGDIRIFGLRPHEEGSGVPGIGVGYMPQDIALQDFMTIGETLTYFGNIYFIDDRTLTERIDNLIKSLDLPDLNRPIGTLSGGQKRRVSLALTVLHKPRLLILDEPTVGCDPILRERIWKSLLFFTHQYHMTIIITTHYIEEARQSDRVGFMRDGYVLREDSPEVLMQSMSANSLEAVFLKICERTTRRPSFYRQKSNVSAVYRACTEKPIENRSPTIELKILHWYFLLLIIMKRINLQMIREKGTLAVQFIIPIFSLMCFCMFVGQVPHGIKIGYVNNDYGNLSDQLINEISDGYFINLRKYDNKIDALHAAKRRDIFGFLVIDGNFSSGIVKRVSFLDVTGGDNKKNVNSSSDDDNFPTLITFHGDVTNWPIRITSERSFVEALLRFVNNVTNSSLQLPIKMEKAIYGQYTPNDLSGLREFSSVGIMVILLYTISFGTTILVVVTEKLDLIFERHFAAGVSTNQLLLAHLLAKLGLQSLLTVTVFVLAINFFDVSHKGSYMTSLILLLSHSITGCCHGLFQSSMTTSFFNASVLSNGIIIFLFASSGVLWPYEALPIYMRFASLALPICWPTESLRAVLIRGWDFNHPLIVYGLLISLGWAAFFLIGAAFFFRYKKT